jgi:copper transport protein
MRPEVLLSPGPGATAAVAPDQTLSRLRRTVGTEVVLAVVVLMVTAALVNTVPARTAFAKTFSAELHTDALLIDLTVDPAKQGPTDVHVYTLSHTGTTAEVEGVTATFTLTDPPVGPLKVPLQKAAPGHYSAYGFELPVPGVWTVDVVVRTSDISTSEASATVTVR